MDAALIGLIAKGNLVDVDLRDANLRDARRSVTPLAGWVFFKEMNDG